MAALSCLVVLAVGAAAAAGLAPGWVGLDADRETPGVNYSSDYRCDDVTTEGDTAFDCEAEIHFDDLGDAEYLKVETVDGLHYRSKSWTVPSVTASSHIWAENHSAGPLQFRDHVIISAVFADGRHETLEHHRFSCEDVQFRDACDDGVKS